MRAWNLLSLLPSYLMFWALFHYYNAFSHLPDLVKLPVINAPATRCSPFTALFTTAILQLISVIICISTCLPSYEICKVSLSLKKQTKKKLRLIFFLLTFYFDLIQTQKSSKNRTKNSHIPFTQIPQKVPFYPIHIILLCIYIFS